MACSDNMVMWGHIIKYDGTSDFLYQLFLFDFECDDAEINQTNEMIYTIFVL